MLFKVNQVGFSIGKLSYETSPRIPSFFKRLIFPKNLLANAEFESFFNGIFSVDIIKLSSFKKLFTVNYI